MDREELKWENEKLAEEHIGEAGMPPQSIDIGVEMSTKVGEKFRGRPRLFVVLNVGNRYLRLDAEGSGGEELSVATKVANFILKATRDIETRAKFDDAVSLHDANRQEHRPGNYGFKPERKPVNDGGPNRGLQATGKTARKKRERSNGNPANGNR